MVNIKPMKALLHGGILLGLVGISLLYLFNFSMIIESFYYYYPGSIGVVNIIITRILILSLMTRTLFRKWFKAEKQFFDDIPFLFGLFFLGLIFGKFLDLFVNFSYYSNPIQSLFISKIRFILLAFYLVPMLYLSIGMLLFYFSINEKHVKVQNEAYRNKVRIKIVVFIIAIEIFIGIMAPNLKTIGIFYPIVLIPSLFIILWLFWFTYRRKKLSEVNSLFLTIGFGILLLSQTIRPILQIIFGENPSMIILAEFLDLIVFSIIFMGFIKKSNYN